MPEGPLSPIADLFVEGFVIGARYRVASVLAMGELGVLLRARHIQLDDAVIVKVLSERVNDARVAARFVREARSGARVKSDHVARFLDVGTLEDGRPFVVMEHLEGEDLEQILKRGEPIDVTTAVDIVMQVCDGLAAAHAVGIVHRDLQPSSIFLARTSTGGQRVKLMNFGTARVPDSEGRQEDAGLTVAGLGLTRLDYMAPELFLRSSADARADIWSLGVVLFELLTGSRPFRGAPTEMTRQMLVEAAPPPSSRRPDLPGSLDAIVLRCLDKRPEGRFDNVGQLAAALAEFASPSGQTLAVGLSARSTAVADPLPLLPSDPADTEDEGSVYKRLPGGQLQKITYDRILAAKRSGDRTPGARYAVWAVAVVLFAVVAAGGIFWVRREDTHALSRAAVVPAPSVVQPSQPRGSAQATAVEGPLPSAAAASAEPPPVALPKRRRPTAPSSSAPVAPVGAQRATADDPWGWNR